MTDEPVDLHAGRMAAARAHVDDLPPHSIPAEQGVLSCLLQASELSSPKVVQLGIQRDDFYDLRHQELFAILMDMQAAGRPIDTLTVTSELMARKQLEALGGGLYLGVIMDAAPSAQNLEYYATDLLQKAELRRALALCNETILDIGSNEYEPDRILSRLESGMMKLRRSPGQSEIRPIGDLVLQVIDEMESSQGKTLGIPTGIGELDKLLSGGGANAGDFIVVAARPSAGKTAWCINWCISAAKLCDPAKEAVVMFSLEMMDKAIVRRMMGIIANVNMRTASTELTEHDANRLLEASGVVTKLPIVIDHSPGSSCSQMRARLKLLSVTRSVRMIVVDYLQMIPPEKSDNRREAVDGISRALKSIAKEFSCPLVVAAQLNRDAERENRKPKKSDLRESGQIEQDADVILFLHPRSKDGEDVTYSTGPTPIWITIGKQREGPADASVPIEFRKTTQTFHPVAQVDEKDMPEPGDQTW